METINISKVVYNEAIIEHIPMDNKCGGNNVAFQNRLKKPH